MTLYFHEMIFKNIFPGSEVDSIDIVRYKYRYSKRTDIDMFTFFQKKKAYRKWLNNSFMQNKVRFTMKYKKNVKTSLVLKKMY